MKHQAVPTPASPVIRSRLVFLLVGGSAIAFGGLIAWVDTRPTWDDTGVTAGLLFVAAAGAAIAGLRWWHAALLIATPLILFEYRTAGSAIFLVIGIALLGGALGQSVRRFRSTRSTTDG